MSEGFISVNELSRPLVEQLIAHRHRLRLEVHRHDNGTHLIDAGVNCTGGIEAGLAIAEICMGGLGRACVTQSQAIPRWPWMIQVQTSQPLLCCLASQYAGWSVSSSSAEHRYFAMASGPGRALARKETLFDEIGYQDQSEYATFILEASSLPPEELSAQIAEQCRVSPSNLTLIVTPTGSLAGGTQVAARIVEVALHKAHELEFPLDRIVDASGVTPLPPPIANDLKAMGRTNDTILFGGRVQLFVAGQDDDIAALAQALPSTCSEDYGEPFEEVFERYERDFFKIDGGLFSPGEVLVTAIDSGNTFAAGSLNPGLIYRSFGLTP